LSETSTIRARPSASMWVSLSAMVIPESVAIVGAAIL
jgi:hypothetical protein